MHNNNAQFRKMLDDRFGIFVHYGIYSEMAGSFNGQETTWLGEWIQKKLEIPIAEYEAFGRANFKPREDFAKNLVSAAKAAGAKYIVLTSKHHDGFCLFKSDYSDYSTYDFFGRDICKELSDECKKQGLELGLYYSHTLDWHEKDAGGNTYSASGSPAKNRNYWDFPNDNIEFDKYLYGKCFPQVKELLTNYGDLKLIWFDFPHDITKAQSQELRALVKSIQPNCQINSRIAHDCCDYKSLGDNVLPIAPVGENLECLITLNDTWGYKRQDSNWKSAKEVATILCRTLTSDASLLLNVGPMGDGSLTTETTDILKSMGEWTTRNKEAIYDGICGNPFPNLFPWGFVSQKESCLYLYVTDSTKKEISLNIGEDNTIKNISVLSVDKEISYTFENGIINICTIDTDLMIPVYKIQLEQKLTLSEEIYQHGEAMSLAVLWAHKFKISDNQKNKEKLIYEKSPFVEGYGKHGLCVNKQCQSDFWKDDDEVMCWDVNFAECGKYIAEVISLPIAENQKPCDFTLSLDDNSNPVDMKKEKGRYNISRTGVENLRVRHDAGVFEIKSKGLYQVLLKRSKNNEEVHIEKIDFIKIQ